MTIKDKNLTFSTAQSVALTAGTTALVSTDKVPLSALADIGIGIPVYLVVAVTTAIVAAGPGTFEVQFVSDTTSIATDTSVTYHLRSGPITTANNSTSNPAGKILMCAPIPMEGSSGTTGAYEALLAVRILATTQDLSSGAIDAYLTTDPQKYKAYANAI